MLMPILLLMLIGAMVLAAVASKKDFPLVFGFSLGSSVLFGVLAMVLGVSGFIEYERYLDVKAEYRVGHCDGENLERVKVKNESFLYGWAIPDDVENIRCHR